MIDPRREAVLIAGTAGGEFEDRTRDVVSYEAVGGKVAIVFRNNPKTLLVRFGPGAGPAPRRASTSAPGDQGRGSRCGLGERHGGLDVYWPR
jgi:hypothetical protein